MEKKVKKLLKRLNDINSMIIDNLNEINIDSIISTTIDFEKNIRKIIHSPVTEMEPPIWTKFSTMTEEEIRQEFNDTKKYPDIESIKAAVKGYLELRKVSKVKTRETLIKHIIETYKRGSFISKIGG